MFNILNILKKSPIKKNEKIVISLKLFLHPNIITGVIYRFTI